MLDALDWPLLEACTCEPGASDGFFSPEAVEALRDAGLVFAEEVLAAVAGLPAGGPGASVYVGVGVAELAPALAEALVAGRAVRLLTLPGEEARELDRALAQVAARVDLPLPRVETGALAALPAAGFDHGWLVSVLNDPDAFPALHDELYGRRTPDEGATGRGDRRAERARAGELVDALLDRLAPGARLTTTLEELPLVRPRLRARGLELSGWSAPRLGALTSDPVVVGSRLVRDER